MRSVLFFSAMVIAATWCSGVRACDGCGLPHGNGPKTPVSNPLPVSEDPKVETALLKFAAIATDDEKLIAWCIFSSQLAIYGIEDQTPDERDAMDKAMDDAIAVIGPNFKENWQLLGALDYRTKAGKAYFKIIVSLQEKCPLDPFASRLLKRNAVRRSEQKQPAAAAASENAAAPRAVANPATPTSTSSTGAKEAPPSAQQAAATLRTNERSEITLPATAQSGASSRAEPSPLRPPTGNGDRPAVAFAAQPTKNESTLPAATVGSQEDSEACRMALNSVVSAKRIVFTKGSYGLAPASQTALKEIAKIATGCSKVLIEVDGYTDNVGSAASNKRLSEGRALAVCDYLAAAGIDPGRLRAVGYGEDRPIASNVTREGRRLNRRIEFIISIASAMPDRSQGNPARSALIPEVSGSELPSAMRSRVRDRGTKNSPPSTEAVAKPPESQASLVSGTTRGSDRGNHKRASKSKKAKADLDGDGDIKPFSLP